MKNFMKKRCVINMAEGIRCFKLIDDHPDMDRIYFWILYIKGSIKGLIGKTYGAILLLILDE